MKRKLGVGVGLLLCIAMLVPAGAQEYAPPPMPNGQILASAQLDQMLGPIALYPDPLVAEVLPAATEPSQIAVAYNYISAGGDPNQVDAQNWDSSVKALARYPDVLKMLAENLPWTTQLGQAYLNQASDVMNSIQRLRAQAQQLGNLANSPQETIYADDGQIEILPTDPDLLYVPIYDPGVIFYTRGYGRSFIRFGIGFHIGAWLHHDFDWHDRRLVTWGRDHPRPSNWWHERPAERRVEISHATPWHAPTHTGPRWTTPSRGDRGFADHDVHVASPPRDNRPAPRAPVHEAPHPAPPVHEQHVLTPPRDVHPEPRSPVVHAPPEVHAPPPVVHAAPAPAPSRPAFSAFTGSRSTQETHAASSRGTESRGVVSRPAPSPAPSHSPAPSSGGGGGGNGGGNGRKH